MKTIFKIRYFLLVLLLSALSAGCKTAESTPKSNPSDYPVIFIGDDSDASTVNMEAVEMPTIRGGMRAVQRKLVYPRLARKNKVEGRVVIGFIVDTNGKAKDFKVFRSLGFGCNRAAISAIKRSSFTPAMSNGKPVEMQMALPITFKL